MFRYLFDCLRNALRVGHREKGKVCQICGERGIPVEYAPGIFWHCGFVWEATPMGTQVHRRPSLRFPGDLSGH